MAFKDLALPSSPREMFEDLHFMTTTLWILVIVLYGLAFLLIPPHPDITPMVSASAFVGGVIPLAVYMYRRFQDVRDPKKFYLLGVGLGIGLASFVHPIFGVVGVSAMIAGIFGVDYSLNNKDVAPPVLLILAGSLSAQLSSLFQLPFAVALIGAVTAFALASVFVYMKSDYALTLTTFAALFLAMLQVPLHEALNVQANRLFGMYDASLIYGSMLGGVVLYISYLRLRRAEEEFYDRLERARELINAKDYARAESLLTMLLDQRKHDPAVKNRLATLYLRTGRYDQAKKLIDEILTENPNYVEALVNLGNYHFFKGEYEKSVEAYRRALDMGGNLPHVWNNMGAAYANLGKIKDAREAFAKALEMDPTFPHAKKNIEKIAKAA